MLKYIFAFLLLIHGLIHIMGFAKAYGYGNIQQLTKEISKPVGSLWLFACLLFLISITGVLLQKEWWPVIALFAVVLSQVLILLSWKDAKFGTIANMLILLTAIFSITTIQFEKVFRTDVKQQLISNSSLSIDLLTESDLQSLPLPVQKYLRYTGAINQPKVKNVRIVFDGEMRDKGKDWFTFQSVQYNFTNDPARLFFMKATMYGITVPGYHHYQKETAGMQIKLFGLFPIVQIKGNEMNTTETVTLFNDMCLMYPASLIDKSIRWESIDNTSAKAIFTNGGITITATLYFNEEGQLINFISDDRYAVSNMKKYRFSTPVRDYRMINGRKVPGYGEAVWHYPEGEFVYGKFNLKTIDYNVNGF
jgi:hypothetical protein